MQLPDSQGTLNCTLSLANKFNTVQVIMLYAVVAVRLVANNFHTVRVIMLFVVVVRLV